MLFAQSEWESCQAPAAPFQVCVNSTDGGVILDVISNSFPLVSSDDTVTTDILSMLVIAFVFKAMAVLGYLYKSHALLDHIDTQRSTEPILSDRPTLQHAPLEHDTMFTRNGTRSCAQPSLGDDTLHESSCQLLIALH